MIARIYVLLLVVIIVPEIYFHVRRHHRKGGYPLWKSSLAWLVCLLMVGYTTYLAMDSDFIPINPKWVNRYLFIFFIYSVPRFIVALCMASGQGFGYPRKRRSLRSKKVGMIISLLIIYVFLYGVTVGVRKLVVKRVDVTVENLPPAFDGYRIVHLSDIHAGSISTSLLEEAVDTVNLLNGDVIAFTGDIQNVSSEEIMPIGKLLASMKAHDGVFSVLGNHDYSSLHLHSKTTEEVKADEQRTIDIQRSFGWNLLLNEHKMIMRRADTIYIAGTEDGGRHNRHQESDMRKATEGIPDGAFSIMLQHTPDSWANHILPETTAELTLSGHTHGGQLSLFGLRALKIVGKKDSGLYCQDGRYLYVTSGLGGLVPFRFGIPPEIVVITLHSSSTGK